MLRHCFAHRQVCVAAAVTASATFVGLRKNGTQAQALAAPQGSLKQQAGYKAIDDYVKSGMVVGLGTGSTAYFAVERLGQKLANKELSEIVAIPTSEATAAQARTLGIPLVDLVSHPVLDVAIDGADEVDPSLNLIKGRGGALLREKMVEMCAKRLVIIVDESKLVPEGGLGMTGSLPIEVTPWQWEHTLRLIKAVPSLKGTRFQASLRMADDCKPYMTDNDNYIINIFLKDSSAEAIRVAEEVQSIVGVVEHGIFGNMTSTVIVAGKHGVRTVEKLLKK